MDWLDLLAVQGTLKSSPTPEFESTNSSGLITSWEIDGETVETVADFIFGGFKITADGDCSRKVMINLDSVLKAEILLCQQRSI